MLKTSEGKVISQTLKCDTSAPWSPREYNDENSILVKMYEDRVNIGDINHALQGRINNTPGSYGSQCGHIKHLSDVEIVSAVWDFEVSITHSNVSKHCYHQLVLECRLSVSE